MQKLKLIKINKYFRSIFHCYVMLTNVVNSYFSIVEKYRF